MDRFSKMHPVFHFVFFVCVFVIIVALYNPFFTVASLICGVAYDVIKRNKKALGSLCFVLTIIGVVSIFNMLFAHYGVDVLFTVGDTEFTLQALLYGLYQGTMLGSFIIWFGIFSRTLDSEKVLYLFRFAPKIALIFSMVLGFIPRFTKKLEDIRDAQLGLNGGKGAKTKGDKLKQGIFNLSALVSYSLEGSIITSNSMAARGYNPKATVSGRYKYKAIDVVFLLLSLGVTSFVIIQKATGKISFVFEPRTYSQAFDVLSFVLFCIMCLVPIITNLMEGILWKLSKSKA